MTGPLRRILGCLYLITIAPAFADIIVTKDGAQIIGVIHDSDLDVVRIQRGTIWRSIARDQIQSIRFDPLMSLTTSLKSRPAANAPLSPSAEASPMAHRSITLPIGQEIAIRTISSIDSKKADTYTEYDCSLDDPIVAGGLQVAPVNGKAIFRVTEIHNKRLKRSSLSTALVAVFIDGQRVNVKTADVDSQSGSHAKPALTGTAVGAGTGAAIGAAAGGGAGAAIGAGTGAAAGTVAGVAAGKSVEIAPETRFTYKLTEAVTVNYNGGLR